MSHKTSLILAQRTLYAGALVACLTSAMSLHTGAASAHLRQSTTPQWATYNVKTHTASLNVISAYGADTYNFNGGKRGHFTFTVPAGATVKVTYTNLSTHMPHGVEIVSVSKDLPTLFPPPAPAFPGAASPNYIHGTSSNVTQHFTFVARRSGVYRMICPVRNHVKFGHWDWFVVSPKAPTATGILAA